VSRLKAAIDHSKARIAACRSAGSPDQSLVVFYVYHLFAQALSRRSIDGISFVCLAAPFEVSSVGARGVTAGTVKLLLPPRQSRGISLGY